MCVFGLVLISRTTTFPDVCWSVPIVFILNACIFFYIQLYSTSCEEHLIWMKINLHTTLDCHVTHLSSMWFTFFQQLAFNSIIKIKIMFPPPSRFREVSVFSWYRSICGLCKTVARNIHFTYIYIYICISYICVRYQEGNALYVVPEFNRNFVPKLTQLSYDIYLHNCDRLPSQ